MRGLRSRTGRLGLWFLAFAGLSVLDALQMFAGQRFEEFTITWALALRRGFEGWMPSAVLALGILRLGERFPFDRERTGRWLLRHLGFSIVYLVAFALVHAAILDGQRSLKGSTLEFGTVFRKVLIFYSVTSVGFYWFVLLGHQGWRYYQRYRERERRAAELEGQLARARLETLRMQLNPHFLFNTLNTIAAMVHAHPPIAERMVTRLSELLRASLDHPDTHEVPLRDELELLRRYLDIEQVRFSDRLSVVLEADVAVEEALVPSLLLQPLVENAIRHGVELADSPGRIEVRAGRFGSRLRLSVRDNGPGPSADATPTRRGGIGLRNTRARLAHLYPGEHWFELRRADGGGAEVEVVLPLKWANARRSGPPESDGNARERGSSPPDAGWPAGSGFPAAGPV